MLFRKKFNFSSAPPHLICDEETRRAWRKSSLPDPKTFYEEMTKDLPPHCDLEVTLNEDGSLYWLGYKKYSLGEEEFHFNREFAGSTVFHAGGEVNNKLQDQGIAKTVGRNLFSFYQKMNYKKVHISAGIVGAYAWARLGFVPHLESWMKIREDIKKRLEYLEFSPSQVDGPLPAKYVSALRAALNERDPKAYWFIVDQSYPYFGTSLGKLLTVDMEYLELRGATPDQELRLRKMKYLRWSGCLDLQDADCVERYQSYLQLKKIETRPALQQAARVMA